MAHRERGPSRPEHEVHFVAVAPGPIDWRGREGRPGLGRARYHGAHQAVDELCFQAKLLGIRNVLPAAAAARTDAGRRADAEVPAGRRSAMR